MSIENSNRLAFVEREKIHGSIDGVNYGYNVTVLARSPRAVLIWSGGTMYTSGRTSVYGQSQLYGLLRNQPMGRGYKSLGPRGGRLRSKRISASRQDVIDLFDDQDIIISIIEAISLKKTLLIEGGGGGFYPSHQEMRRKGMGNLR